VGPAHGMSQMMSRTYALLPAAALVFLYGCSTAKPPTAILSNAELGIRAADEAKAEQLAPVDLKNARDKLARAKQAMAAERYDDARRLAESAQVDAELAEAKAEAEVVRRAADQVLRKADLPPTEAERESRTPLAPPPEKE
jgi:uncharacterized protein DUF4398